MQFDRMQLIADTILIGRLPDRRNMEAIYAEARVSSPLGQGDLDALEAGLIRTGIPPAEVKAQLPPVHWMDDIRPLLGRLLQEYVRARDNRSFAVLDFDLRFLLFGFLRSWRTAMSEAEQSSVWRVIASTHVRGLESSHACDRAELGFLLYWAGGIGELKPHAPLFRGAKHGSGILQELVSAFQNTDDLLKVFWGIDRDFEAPRCQWEEWDGDEEDSTPSSSGLSNDVFKSLTNAHKASVVHGVRFLADQA